MDNSSLRPVQAGPESQVTAMPERLHHIGFALPSIAKAAHGFISGFRMDWDEEVFHDAPQTVRVTFCGTARPRLL
jgi:hypothetical protein